MGDRLAGKVAFVTGVARGQGRRHALRLAEEGADIVGVDLCAQIDTVPYPMAGADDLAETVRLVEAGGGRMVSRVADVRDPDSLRAALDAGLERFGHLDVVVANAGIWSHDRARDLSRQMWLDMIDVNLTGVWNTCQAALPALIDGGRGGSMILVSSTAGLRGNSNNVHYAAAKHGVVGLMRSLAHELAPHSIRVNTIHPTTVDTDMIRNEAMVRLFRPATDSPSMDDAVPAFRSINLLPVPWVETDDVSNAVIFLASDDARYITSVALPVDAGAAQR